MPSKGTVKLLIIFGIASFNICLFKTKIFGWQSYAILFEMIMQNICIKTIEIFIEILETAGEKDKLNF